LPCSVVELGWQVLLSPLLEATSKAGTDAISALRGALDVAKAPRAEVRCLPASGRSTAQPS
jgi:hypothetical protein